MSMSGEPSDGRLRAVDLDRGTNQTGVRLYNERLVLSLIRREGALPKADLARLTGLSAQTVSVIVKQLEADGLVAKGQPQRGRVGQPSVPFALNPDGAYSFGLKIGRRSADLVLIDFLGKARRHRRTTYAYHEPARLLAFVEEGVAAFTADLGEAERARIVGLGIASPYQLWNWTYEVGAPAGALDVWRTTDIRAEIAAVVPWPVHFCNDATAACAAELVFGGHPDRRDWLYFFVGSFVGGGVVLNGALHPGSRGNAGAIGSMPVPTPYGVQQLIRAASLYRLEERLITAGKEAGWLWTAPDAWDEASAEVDDWILQAADALAYAITAATAVIDFPAAVIDGAFPAAVRARLVEGVIAAIGLHDRQGLSPVDVLPGTIGAAAREIGGASLPFFANFAMDREVLFKETA
ncbi:ROK family transcriptional regulator [Oharaeibacter diazotrophicus]|uniref:Putative NBD/HSP70 family sugar kinase n=1 Tax=Oharaeibacter diazotrophicus TaxID=1920512 RepID=A0A4R6RBQ9_9HYPH|nr:ROK family transcriptional regulator [Oharaeibacter diazotrophicus]TDP83570.1 putative NBD/HSP70 family sugar kinase [Oharaeibacter diazotrophicus]BBE72403.1 N-acetylglucosamine repressor [Pleomorphomonas sp. SM30]GLS79173.1 sugar kinase [Oharaeibacter diazotrophicus]